MPVFLTGRNPDNVSRSNFFDRITPALNAAGARRNYKSLAQGMAVPTGAGARFKVNPGSG